MKRLIMVTAFVLGFAVTLYAAGELTMPTAGSHPVQAFTPKTFAIYSGTTTRISSSGKLGIKFRSSVAGKYGNDTGAKYPVDADTSETYMFPRTGLTYATISTASKSYKYVQGM